MILSAFVIYHFCAWVYEKATVIASNIEVLEFHDPVLASLPKFESSKIYTYGVFQDYTDYGKYTYADVTEAQLKSGGYLKKLYASDISELVSYIENFEQWVSIIEQDSELVQNYDFDTETITPGDWCYMQTKGISSGKFDYYSIYLFDIETQTLFYFHNNI